MTVQESGPYLVHKGVSFDCGPDDADHRIVSSVAVATLDEARRAALLAVHEHALDRGSTEGMGEPFDAARALPVEGGTIKLPDGSTITVEQTDMWVLLEALDLKSWPWDDVAGLCAAFNDATRGEGR